MCRMPIRGGRVNSSDARIGDADALRGGEKIPMRGGLQLEIAREKGREGALDHQSECHAEQAARQPERDGLEQVNPHDVAGPRADAFHDRDGIHALLDVRAHGGADADGADDERDQTHQAQKCCGAVQALRDDGVRLAIVGNQGVGERGFQQRRVCSMPGERGESRNRKRSAARLPGIINPVRSKPSRVIITRGPTLRLPNMRSGS